MVLTVFMGFIKADFLSFIFWSTQSQSAHDCCFAFAKAEFRVAARFHPEPTAAFPESPRRKRERTREWGQGNSIGLPSPFACPPFPCQFRLDRLRIALSGGRRPHDRRRLGRVVRRPSRITRISTANIRGSCCGRSVRRISPLATRLVSSSVRPWSGHLARGLADVSRESAAEPRSRGFLGQSA